MCVHVCVHVYVCECVGVCLLALFMHMQQCFGYIHVLCTCVCAMLHVCEFLYECIRMGAHAEYVCK